ncbi:MAG: hypothetical protein ACPG4Q_00245 [Phycisphaeraceae bacterium]
MQRITSHQTDTSASVVGAGSDTGESGLFPRGTLYCTLGATTGAVLGTWIGGRDSAPEISSPT